MTTDHIRSPPNQADPLMLAVWRGLERFLARAIRRRIVWLQGLARFARSPSQINGENGRKRRETVDPLQRSVSRDPLAVHRAGRQRELYQPLAMRLGRRQRFGVLAGEGFLAH